MRVKSWLITELKDYADEHKTKYVPIAEIIRNAKEQENLQNAQNEEQEKTKQNKTKAVEMQAETSKNK